LLDFAAGKTVKQERGWRRLLHRRSAAAEDVAQNVEQALRLGGSCETDACRRNACEQAHAGKMMRSARKSGHGALPMSGAGRLNPRRSSHQRSGTGKVAAVYWVVTRWRPQGGDPDAAEFR
jgi:hypothetical protein